MHAEVAAVLKRASVPLLIPYVLQYQIPQQSRKSTRTRERQVEQCEAAIELPFGNRQDGSHCVQCAAVC